MAKTTEAKAKKTKSDQKVAPDVATLGRKRDNTLDSTIIDAATTILAEVGFDSMTMDMVAAKAKAGKATLYRRWTSKAELVRDALINMSKSSIDIENLPDTGNLKSDLMAIIKPYNAEHAQKKMRVLDGLGSFFTEHKKLAEEAMSGIFDPQTKAQVQLMKRAQQRGEISVNADIQTACTIIIAMVSYRTRIQGKRFDMEYYGELLDGVLLPGLRSGKK
ncbi:MAG: TetR/AcrR family transcriptional regulator [Bdellovibrionaceae bacterium]|nr:TetR/AcrR family transcriptional regulator [Pseudobdellovibrionaceae bacterium]